MTVRYARAPSQPFLALFQDGALLHGSHEPCWLVRLLYGHHPLDRARLLLKYTGLARVAAGSQLTQRLGWVIVCDQEQSVTLFDSVRPWIDSKPFSVLEVLR